MPGAYRFTRRSIRRVVREWIAALERGYSHPHIVAWVTEFARIFGRPHEVEAEAPGRVNLIGEHTDYNGGFVLPMALPLTTRVRIARRSDRRVRAFSADVPVERASAEYVRGEERRSGGWIDYVQGVTSALAARGHDVPGVDVYVQSRVPAGSGLASSAALEVAVLRALRLGFDLPLDDVTLARVAHEAETGLVGAPVGMMDQMAASLADARTALFLDTRSLLFERVPLPPGAELAIVDSGITHNHAAGDYRRRRAECERAASLLGVDQLRDVALAELPRAARLPAPLDRRVRHVVTENQRVLDAVQAMRAGDLARLGALFAASHASMRDDYEVSLPEIDRLVALACADTAVAGARLTGGGFGGSVLILCAAGAAGGVAHGVRAAYHAATGRPGRVLLPAKAAGWHDN